MRRLAFPLVLAGLVGLSSPALAQQAPAPAPAPEQDFKPSNQQLDSELDESLKKEYAEAPPAPPPPPPPVVVHEEKDKLRLRLGGMAAHFVAALTEVEVSHREGSLGGQRIRLTDDGFADFDVEHIQTYSGWFEIGKHVAFEGGYRSGVFRDLAAAPTAFGFGGSTYAQGEQVDSKITAMTADLDLVLKPLNNRWVELGLHLGARYMFWRTELNGSGLNREESTLEAAVPVVGAHLALRPFKWWELFARGRFGYLSYDRPESYSSHDGHTHHTEAKDKMAKSVEVDVGTQFLYKETIGVVLGVRVDYYLIEREVDSQSETAEGLMKGVYGGLILQF